MAFWKRLFVVVAISFAVLLVQGTVNAAPAQAAMYKFTFNGEGVDGYMIYDDSAKGEKKSPYMTQYYGGGRDYKIDLGEKGVFDGTVSNAVVFLARKEDKTLSKIKAEHDKAYGKEEKRQDFEPKDLFLLQIRSFERQPKSKYSLVSYFKYPIETFHGSTELPTSFPSTAEVEIFPKVNFPRTLGEALFKGQVQTKLEKISD